ncbi:MAG TPA: carboxymuconolactone decarboxylase family protein [Trebonia sp.]
MAHIELGNDMAGIRGLLAYRPETGVVLSQLGDVLLRGGSTLPRGERELIAAYVSRGNQCEYCTGSHSATAAAQLPGGMAQVEATLAGLGARTGTETRSGTARPGEPGSGEPGSGEPWSEKLSALLDIAGLVRVDGRLVSDAAVTKARAAGATDAEIHDTVLIAAAFCMFNRYVDGLGTAVPADPAEYAAGAEMLVRYGYQQPR